MTAQKVEDHVGQSFQEIIEDLGRDVSSLQQPSELIMQMIYSMPMYGAIRIIIEAGIFRRLATSSQPISASELAKGPEVVQKSDTEQDLIEREDFLNRMLRAVCTLHLADESEPSMYMANDLTRTLADPGFEAGFNQVFKNTLGPDSTVSHMLTWAKNNGFKAPLNSTDGPFQQARGIAGTTTFQHWVQNDRATLSDLSAFMKRIQPDRLNWSAWFPAEALFGPPGADKEDGHEEIFMVDVGGGLGHDLSGFARMYPDRKLRLVLQDLPEVIEEAKTQDLDSKIELSEHDFFQPQPIKGARVVSDPCRIPRLLMDCRLTVCLQPSTSCTKFSTIGQTSNASKFSPGLVTLCCRVLVSSSMTRFFPTRGVLSCTILL